ncbi:MAG: DUF998 domain-containing protein [Streptococcaceae bacterium]|jgi:hypothetical protein|nr:DUF998 domain-containing protein [Streptococcaceae bacterium]
MTETVENKRKGLLERLRKVINEASSSTDQSSDEEISLPKELYMRLDLDPGAEEVEVTELSRDSFTIKARSQRHTSDYAPRWFLLPTVIATVIFLSVALILHPHVIPMSGNLSIATGSLVIANAAAFVTFILAYINHRKDLYHSMTPRIYWRTFPVVLASYLMVVSLAMVALYWFIDQIFHGVAFDIWTSTLIFAIFTGILCYFVIQLVETWSINMLTSLMILVVIGGLVSSMATNGNQYWWQRNFSLLGTRASHASLQFNLTLVISAALFLALVDYIFVSMAQKYGHNWRHTVLRLLMSGSALSIAGVGLVPNNGLGLAHFWHDQISMFIVYFMAFAILLIRWLLPEAGRTLQLVSYGIVLLLIIVYILWYFVSYFSLTSFEILSFSLSFAWFMLFINTLLSLLWNEKRTYKVVSHD